MKSSKFLHVALCFAAVVATLFGLRSIPSRANAAEVSGEATYKEFCATCHDHPGPRVPPRVTLQQLSAVRILHTLDFGVMMNVAYPMQRSQGEAEFRLPEI